MMKKPPGLWLLLSAGVLWLCFQDVTCVRATSLIFGKSTTSTTSTTSLPDESASAEGNPPASEDPPSDTNSNSTQTAKSNYTGIPQVDYQWDPNLPRELNGFNLTEYPFYDRLPEDIDFKCDGLHDGFYASVRHKCQVYHHCLFGTRYDFLCANYTAFDQKTFICHFVSEVDCANSKKFWHRNDALYEAASTTTVKPQVIYTPPSAPAMLHTGSGGGAGGRRAPLPQRRRKPARRRRPQYEYYDVYEDDEEDYYDEPRYTATESPRSEGRRRNNRPRPRPRPVYDDDYDEYEEERYDRRRGSSRRGEDERRYKSRPSARRSNKDDRRKYEADYEEYEEDDRSDERRSKKPQEKRVEKRPSDERRPRPRKSGSRRPTPDEDYEEDERRPGKRKEDPPTAPSASGGDERDKALVKPAGSSVYDRPRVAPKIRPPVPKNEADKYAYKTTVRPTDAEYYEDYEESVAKKASAKDTMADASIASTARKTSSRDREVQRERERDRDTRRSRPKQHAKRPIHEEEYYEEEEDERPSKRPVASRNEDRRRKKPASMEYADEEYEERSKLIAPKATTPSTTSTTTTPITTLRRKFGGVKDARPKASSTSTSTTTASTTTASTTTTTTITQAPPKEDPMGPIKSVRIVKRPFLPSRGGNPYLPRGLQPIGLKSEQSIRKGHETGQQNPVTEPEVTHGVDDVEETPATEKPDVAAEYYRPVTRPAVQTTFRQVYKSVSSKETQATSNQTPKPVERNPLDINETEYDVTLNDALNPTLPNLPLRTFPSGFSNNVNSEYSFNGFYRPRYVVDASINQAGSEIQYRFKPPAAQPNGHAPQSPDLLRQPVSHSDVAPQYSHNYQHFRRLPQAQTFYATY